MPTMQTKITSAHFFAGCGGDVTGFAMAGLKPVMALEIGKDRCQTLRHNHPDLKVVEKPVQDFTLAEYPAEQRALVHCYSFPCQKYSLAAAVHGTRTGDNLYLEALREAVLMWPEVIVVENVMGFRHFKRAMETWQNLAHYHTTEMIVRGEWFSLQRKTRIFLILHRQLFKFLPLYRYSEKGNYGERRLGDYLELDGPANLKVPDYIYKRLDGEYRDQPNVYHPEQRDPIALTTNYKRDRSNHLIRDERYPKAVRPFSVRELANLHGFPSSYQLFGSLGEQYGQVVDSIMPVVAKALGHAIQEYFASISDLAKQPRHLGRNFIG